MATKAQVLELHRKYPEWTSVDIAERLNCESAYVRATFYRNGLQLTKRPVNGIYALGRAAKMAGLTVQAIEAMARTS